MSATACVVLLAACGGGEGGTPAGSSGSQEGRATALSTTPTAPVATGEGAANRAPPRWTPRQGAGVVALAPSRDGSLLTLANRAQREVQTIELASGRARAAARAWPWQGGTDADIPGAALALGATRLLGASRDSTIKVWDFSSGQALASWSGHAQGVRSVTVSEDGTRAASAGDDGRVLLWEVSSGRLLRVLVGAFGFVDALAWSADGAWLATGAADGRVRLWSLSTGAAPRQVLAFEAHPPGVQALAFSADGAWLASGGRDGGVALWNVTARRLERSLTAGSPVSALAFAGGGAWLVAGTEDGRLLQWATASGALR